MVYSGGGGFGIRLYGFDIDKFWIRIRWDVTAIALEHRTLEIFEIAPEIFEIAPGLRYINQSFVLTMLF